MKNVPPVGCCPIRVNWAIDIKMVKFALKTYNKRGAMWGEKVA